LQCFAVKIYSVDRMGKVMGILFLIMIDTLYVYHRPVFSPKMTLNAVYNSSTFAPCFASLCVNVCVFSVFFPLQNEQKISDDGIPPFNYDG